MSDECEAYKSVPAVEIDIEHLLGISAKDRNRPTQLQQITYDGARGLNEFGVHKSMKSYDVLNITDVHIKKLLQHYVKIITEKKLQPENHVHDFYQRELCCQVFE